jgi:predicted kinase
MNKPTLLILRGPSGAGKSTAAKLFAQENDYAHIEIDAFIFDLHPAKGKPHALIEQNVTSVAKNFIKAKQSFILEGAMVAWKKQKEFPLQAIIRYAKQNHYGVYTIQLTADTHRCVERMHMRGIVVPKTAFNRIRKASEEKSTEYAIIDTTALTPAQVVTRISKIAH